MRRFFFGLVYFGLSFYASEKSRWDRLCADPESFDRGGSAFDNVSFLVVEGREDPNTTISGPSSVRQRNAI